MSVQISMTESTVAEKLHPFEAAGMGHGPYRWQGIYDLAEALDPNSARNFGNMGVPDPLRPKLKAGMGTCACCGHAIMIICIVRDANGDLWGVGSDCVEKTGDKCLGDAAKVAVARRRAKLRRQAKERKRQADHEAWLDSQATDKRANPGETNRVFLARWNAELKAAEAARVEAMVARWNSLPQYMREGLTAAANRSEFWSAAYYNARNGIAMPPRMADIVIGKYCPTDEVDAVRAILTK